MAEVVSGTNLTVIVLNEEETDALRSMVAESDDDRLASLQDALK
jgi:hypothetical protein